jgi:hypothetical protein
MDILPAAAFSAQRPCFRATSLLFSKKNAEVKVDKPRVFR